MKPHSVPKMNTDAEAEAFLDQDLSDLDFTAFKPLTRESEPKTARVNMRLPAPLMAALKARAAERGIPYQRLIREAIERAVRRLAPSPKASEHDRNTSWLCKHRYQLVNLRSKDVANQPLNFMSARCALAR